MWGALGFLPPPKESETMDDVANQYLFELWSRSFLSDYLDMGGTCYFKIHDLVSDLAVYVAKGEFELIDTRNPKISDHVQHLAFMENNLLGQALLPTSLRTIIFTEGTINEASLNTSSSCKYLRVLMLDFSEFENLPRCIEKLKHLRYLSLAGNEKLKGLPDSLCSLQNLQTLNLSGCYMLGYLLLIN
ncbi:hypothetical protein VNO78_21338 [Psophocarpus tetragonolobus]|uniref:Uncharacterized protein n=1 Tax=Psophocarpus tetragonolobus TaxID=3891 RepID=A0AAN9XIA5_PSOTE